MAELAVAFGYRPVNSGLTRTFTSLYERLHRRTAARLLRETNRSIADIADAAGFSDQSYFDKRFKRAFGRAPKEFRAEAVR